MRWLVFEDVFGDSLGHAAEALVEFLCIGAHCGGQCREDVVLADVPDELCGFKAALKVLFDPGHGKPDALAF